MPPPKKQAEQDPNRVHTQAANVNTHPGIAAKNALRAQNPPRDSDIIQQEKDHKGHCTCSKAEHKMKNQRSARNRGQQVNICASKEG